MTYRQKRTVLSGIVAALALIYILTFVFDPNRRGSRSDAYAWLEAGQKEKIDGITITSAGETIVLIRRGNEWFVSRGGKNYPARRLRVDDFIEALARRAPYPVLSSSASSHERLWLTEERSVRITVTAGVGLPLLQLLIGQEDIMGRNVYMRKQGQNEVRSGEDIFSTYTRSTAVAWFNLRLFPDSEGGMLDETGVQRLSVYPPAADGEAIPPRIFTRSGRTWIIDGMELADPDMAMVDNYVRDIINMTGNDFEDTVNASDPLLNDCRLVLELGNGSIRTVRIGPAVEDGRRFAAVSGSDLVYVLPSWAASRLFPEPGYFEKN